MSIQSVERALSVLEHLAQHGAAGVTDIATRLDVTKASASRLLATLAARGFVERESGTRRYCLGLRTANVGLAYLHRLDLRREAQPFLMQLSEASGETASVSIRNGNDVVYIDRVTGSHVVRQHVEIGDRVPLHVGAAGKAILAHLSPAERDEVLSRPLQAYTARTISTVELLRLELAKIRKQGFALGGGEYTEGSSGVAAPIFDYERSVIGALALGGPAVRFESRLDEYTRLVSALAAELSRRLGMSERAERKTM